MVGSGRGVAVGEDVGVGSGSLITFCEVEGLQAVKRARVKAKIKR